jgi:hypothetical protein
MNKIKFTKDINIISKDEFISKRPQFKATLDSQIGTKLFDFTIQKEIIMDLIYFSKLTNSPAVEGVINSLKAIGINSLENREKQFFGALVCDILESNGFEKTGKKSTVKSGIFTTGEVYRVKSNL